MNCMLMRYVTALPDGSVPLVCLVEPFSASHTIYAQCKGMHAAQHGHRFVWL